MKTIHEPVKVRNIDYFLVFYKSDGLSGFRFPCNKIGVVDHLQPLAFENYIRCCNKDLNVSDGILEKESTTYSVSSVVLCSCGQEYYSNSTCPVCANSFSMAV